MEAADAGAPESRDQAGALMAMSYQTVVIAVNWYGPFYSIEEAKRTAKDNGVGEAIYLLIDKQKKAALRYVGISKALQNRFNNQHSALNKLAKGSCIWLGLVDSHAIAGRKKAGQSTSHSRGVALAEGLTAYFLKLPENDRKRRKEPDVSAILINRWFRGVDPFHRWKHRAHEDWPDLIEWDQVNQTASLVWFGGKRIVYRGHQISSLARK
jgi:hypothetical protein